MIIITITISIVYAIILGWLAYTWYKDLKYKEDIDKRILVLEKRDAEKETKKNVKQINDIVITNTIDLQSLEKRFEKLERKKKSDKNDKI